jgi:hypothetical protein
VFRSNPDNKIANAAHLGGLLFGYAVVRFGPRLHDWFQSKSSGSWSPSAKEERSRDEILDKVSREGINSLTWRERRFMRRFRRK